MYILVVSLKEIKGFVGEVALILPIDAKWTRQQAAGLIQHYLLKMQTFEKISGCFRASARAR